MEILILRLMRSASFTISASPPPASHQCTAIRHYIDTHYKEPLSLDDLARETHINKFYLAHAFKEEYGVSPINYMLSRRIQESRYLLRETNMSMSQIARFWASHPPAIFPRVFAGPKAFHPLNTERYNPAALIPDGASGGEGKPKICRRM